MPRFSFSYSITRSYPYPWLPWAVVVGSVVCFALVSVFSLATNGYYLKLVYTTSLNETLARPYWFNRSPFSWTEHMYTQCQAAEIQAETAYLTDKMWRKFTIELRDRTNITEPVFMYSNNILENCTVDYIGLYVPSSNATLEDLFQGKRNAPDLQAEITCFLSTPQVAAVQAKTSMFAFSNSIWDIIHHTPDPSRPASADEIKVSGYTLAEIIDRYTYNSMMTERDFRLDQSLVPGLYRFRRNNSVTDINSDFVFEGTGSIEANKLDVPKWLGHLHANFTLPFSVERLAKIFYSLVLADLGQTKSTIFEAPDLLLDWVRAVSDYDRDGRYKVMDTASNSRFNKTLEFWEKAYASMPAIGPSTIFTQYICQVPEFKPPGALIMAVFLADMVILRAIWWLFSKLMLWWLERSDPSAMVCPGCAYRLVEEGMRINDGNDTLSTLSSKTMTRKDGPR